MCARGATQARCRGTDGRRIPNLASLLMPFLNWGFATLRESRRRYIGPQELQPLSQLQLLDEVEGLEVVLNQIWARGNTPH